jgi:hypothetical protein
MTIIKAAAVQISPVLYSREGTVDRVNSGNTGRTLDERFVCRSPATVRPAARLSDRAEEPV